jgi:hypothetical protein
LHAYFYTSASRNMQVVQLDGQINKTAINISMAFKA